MTYPNTSAQTANSSGALDAPGSGGDLYRPLSLFSVLTLTLLAMLVVATFVWNLLVLVTILRVRTFHRVPHNLVASMAISDVMVAALVMPLSLVHELNGRLWKLGRVLCQVWISFDVLCCTASIWNVTAIALDRYWSITRHLEYTLKTRKKISNVMIALTWLLSSIISLSPLFGWGETYSEGMKCQVSQEPSYTIFSTFGAFYLPLCVVLFVYWKIYKAAKFRIGSRKTNTITPMAEVITRPVPFYMICLHVSIPPPPPPPLKRLLLPQNPTKSLISTDEVFSSNQGNTVRRVSTQANNGRRPTHLLRILTGPGGRSASFTRCASIPQAAFYFEIKSRPTLHLLVGNAI